MEVIIMTSASLWFIFNREIYTSHASAAEMQLPINEKFTMRKFKWNLKLDRKILHLRLTSSDYSLFSSHFSYLVEHVIKNQNNFYLFSSGKILCKTCFIQFQGWSQVLRKGKQFVLYVYASYIRHYLIVSIQNTNAIHLNNPKPNRYTGFVQSIR
jgi:hypothetical protein